MDLRDFFPSFSGARIQSFFRTMASPNRLPICSAESARTRHLGTHGGTSESTSIGFICGKRKTSMLVPISQGAPTSCVGQPLYVSGGLPSGEPGAIGWCGVHAICRRSRVFHRRDIIRAASRTILNTRCPDSDGRTLSVHQRKTRIMRRGVRQYRAGLVVNRHFDVVRTDFDRLKATLTNCVRLSPESQNREGHSGFRLHLEGRVGFVEMINPRRGERLRAMFERIRWP